MTETYIPKVDDKVRATLSENVLVGKVAWTTFRDGSLRSLDIRVDNVAQDGQITLYMVDGWHFEQVIDVPTKPFAVVASADNKKGYTRDAVGVWTSVISGGAASPETIAYLIRDEGYRVVFEGVDE